MTPSRSLVRLSPGAEGAVRLVCFAYAGGSVSVFRPWPGALDPSVDTWAVQYPGRESRMGEPPFTRVADLVDALLPEFAVTSGPPLALFGHSMGALVAFELTRALLAAGLPAPSVLVVSGKRPPHLPPRPDQPTLYQLSDAGILERLREMGGTDPAVLDNAELMALILPMLRADFELVEAYEPIVPGDLGVPIVALGGTDDPYVNEDELAEWALHTSQGFSRHMVPGGHFFLRENPAPMFQAVRAAIREVA